MSSGLQPVATTTFRLSSRFLLLAIGVSWMTGPFGVANANDLFADRIVKEGNS